MNVVGLKSFTVENTQLLRRFSRPPRASEEDIGHWGLSIFKKMFKYIKETINNNFIFTGGTYNSNHDWDSKQLT